LQPANFTYRDNLAGQSISVDVLVNPGWTNGYLELLIGTSYHAASAGRPAGSYSVAYQIVPSGAAGSVANGNNGVITVPFTPANGGWMTLTITPATDIAALWPDQDAADFGLYQLTLNAVSTGDLVSGYFGYLRFARASTGGELFAQQQDMMAAPAVAYPAVTQQQGLEVSWHDPHLNWFGPGIAIPSYGEIGSAAWPAYLAGTAVPAVHAAGGLVSYNHPFGTRMPAAYSEAQQDALVAQVAASMLPAGAGAAALGCDILEVGYPQRAGVDLAHHLALWDVMSRNAVFLTGNGTSDDHAGEDWYGDSNNWVTTAWAPDTTLPSLLAALAAGQVSCGSLSGFGGGALNLVVDGECPMGSVSVSGLTARQLDVTATGMPTGSTLQVLQAAPPDGIPVPRQA